MRDPREIIKRPIITEKTTRLRDLYNKVVFEVALDANKVEIRKAVEKLFNVKVKSVNTIRVKGKHIRLGNIKGKKRDMKKAIVTLYPGEKIELFEGV